MLMDVKATAEETGGVMGVIDSRLTAAANPPLHVHHAEDESFFVVEGEVAFHLGGDDAEPRVARAGDFVFGPRGVPHRFEILSPEARMLVVITPGGGERFFQDLGVPAVTRTLPVPTPPDPAQVVRVAADHDVEIIPPPAH